MFSHLLSCHFPLCFHHLLSVAMFTHESENWQCFPAFSHATFHYASITCCCILSGVQLLSCIKTSAPGSLLAVESRNKQQSILFIDCISVSAQALIYPLTVASKSASSARKNAANQILKNMCEHSHQLVQQAVMVGSLLIRSLLHLAIILTATAFT